MIVLLALVFTLTLVSAISVQAKKPLVGTADVEFNLLWPGPQEYIPDWAGNITFNGYEYRILFFAIGSGKAFVDDPGKVHFFEEIWAIYDTEDFTTYLPNNETTFWEDWLPSNDPAPTDLVLWGYDAGVVSLQNSKYRMNGNVEEAFGAFEVWQGRNVHISGEIIWYDFGAPHYAPGIFRIN